MNLPRLSSDHSPLSIDSISSTHDIANAHIETGVTSGIAARVSSFVAPQRGNVPHPRREDRIGKYGDRLQKEIAREGHVDVALDVLKSRHDARSQNKSSRVARAAQVLTGRTSGRTAIYNNAGKPAGEGAQYTHHPDLNVGWLGIDDEQFKALKIGIRKAGLVEPLHSVAGRGALFAGQLGSPQLASAAAKIVLKETVTSLVAAPLSAGARIITEVAQKGLLRSGGAPRLARNIANVPGMAAVRSAMQGQCNALKESNDALRNALGDFQGDGQQATPAELKKLYAEHMKARAKAGSAQMQYKLCTASARRQHIGKAWGAAVNLVSGVVATPLTLSPLAPVGLTLQGSLIGAQMGAGYVDEGAKHNYTARLNLKYGDILNDDAQHKQLDLVKPQDIDTEIAQGAGIDLHGNYHLLTRAELSRLLNPAALHKLDFQITRDDISPQKLHDLFEGSAEARLGLTREIYTFERSALEAARLAITDRLDAQGKPLSATKTATLQAQLKEIDAHIIQFEREVDHLEFGNFDRVDPAGTVGRCLGDDFYLFTRGVAAGSSKPGQFWAQALQRYFGNFHALAGPGVATILHDVLLATEGVGFGKVSSPEYSPTLATADTAAATVGGAVAAVNTGSVRQHKDAVDKIKLAGPSWLRSKSVSRQDAEMLNSANPELPVDAKDLARAQKTQQKVQRLLERWTTVTPGGNPIDMTRTSACYKDMVPLHDRVMRVASAVPAGLVSGPVGIVNTLKAKPARAELKRQLNEADKLLAALGEMLAEAQRTAPPSAEILPAHSAAGRSAAAVETEAPGAGVHSARISHRGKYYPGYTIGVPRSSESISAFTPPGDGYHEVQRNEYAGVHTMHMYEQGRMPVSPKVFQQFLVEDNRHLLASQAPESWGPEDCDACALELARQGASLDQVARFMNHARLGTAREKVWFGTATFIEGMPTGPDRNRTVAHFEHAERAMIEYRDKQGRHDSTHCVALVRGADGQVRAMDSRAAPGTIQPLGTDMPEALKRFVEQSVPEEKGHEKVVRYIVDLEIVRESERRMELPRADVETAVLAGAMTSAPTYTWEATQNIWDIDAPSNNASRMSALQFLQTRTVFPDFTI